MGNYFCSRRFVEAYCQSGEANIQDYAHALNILTEIFLHTNYYADNADVFIANDIIYLEGIQTK